VAESALIVILVAALPLEHTPGLRATLCIVLGVLGLWQMVAGRDFSLPTLAWGWVLWFVWASASYFWSVAPERTLADLKHDLWLPALALVGAYYVFRRRHTLALLLWAAAAGTLTNGFVVLFGGPMAPYPVPIAQYYFSTIAYASTYALCCLAVALPWVLDKTSPRMRSVAAIVVLLNTSVGVLLESRAFILIVALMLAAAVIVLACRGQRRIAYAVGGTVLAMMAAFALINRDRTAIFTGDRDIAASLEHVANEEVRYSIWRNWGIKIIAGPALGVGFGRDVPATTLTSVEREEMSPIDPFATMHAHNVFLSVVAETGWPGLFCFLLMLGQVAYRFMQATKNGNGHIARAGWSGLFLLAAVTLKNQTDYVLVFGTATMVYLFLGGILAWSRDPRSSS
jgi:O-antigen ligase